MLTLRYTVGREDIVALRRMCQTRPEGRQAIIREYLSWLTVMCVVGGALLFGVTARHEVPLVPIVAGVVCAVAAYSGWYWYALRRADAAFVNQVLPAAGGAHEMSLTEDGIRERRAESETFHRWPTVREIQERAEHIFVLLAGGGVYTIPKRDLTGTPTPEEVVAQVKARIARNVGAV